MKNSQLQALMMPIPRHSVAEESNKESKLESSYEVLEVQACSAIRRPLAEKQTTAYQPAGSQSIGFRPAIWTQF